MTSVCGTARILQPNMMEFSPTMGLLTSLSPHLIANLRTFPVSSITQSPPLHLARELFYQRENQGRRYGPVAPTNSKSHASQWLSPSRFGHIVGLSISQPVLEGKLTAKDIHQHLASIDIKCNYVADEWTGVSLERYCKLINTITHEYLQSRRDPSSLAVYTLPLITAFVWERAESKACLLGTLIPSYPSHILTPFNQCLDFLLSLEASSGRAVLLDEYKELRFDSSVRREWLSMSLSPGDIAKDKVHSALSRVMSTEAGIIPQLGESYEILAASLARERSCKPAIKLGRFSYLDGPTKPDCVEVVVREVVEGLIFDVDYDCLRPELLPAATDTRVRAFFLDEESSGQDWFNLCSELTGCLYLSQASAGQLFELRPTMANVCRALGMLLARQTHWTSLQDLAQYWNAHSGRVCVEGEHRVAAFRAPFSDTERVVREIGVLHFVDRNDCMEIELEDSHGLASVKHQRSQSEGMVWVGEPLYSTVCREIHQTPPVVVRDVWFRLLQAAVVSDASLDFIGDRPGVLELAHALLSCRWGEERGAVRLGAHGVISASDGNLAATALREAQAATERLSLLALSLLASEPLTRSPQVVLLLGWTLRMMESTVVAEKIALTLGRQPADHKGIMEALRQHQEGRLLIEMVSGLVNGGETPTSPRSLHLALRVISVRCRLYSQSLISVLVAR